MVTATPLNPSSAITADRLARRGHRGATTCVERGGATGEALVEQVGGLGGAPGHREGVDQRVLDDLALRPAAAQRRHRATHGGERRPRGERCSTTWRPAHRGATTSRKAGSWWACAWCAAARPTASPSAATGRRRASPRTPSAGRAATSVRRAPDLARQGVLPGAGHVAAPQQRPAVDQRPRAGHHRRGQLALVATADGVDVACISSCSAACQEKWERWLASGPRLRIQPSSQASPSVCSPVS